MPSELHETLCLKAVAWLKRQGFSVAMHNVWSVKSRERVDAIGFRHQCSALIEVKVSRADFRADKKKPERQQGGVGVYRYYMAPEGVLSVEDIPEGWGLLLVSGRKVVHAHGPKGNLWPGVESTDVADAWAPFMHQPDQGAERGMLFSVARQLSLKSGGRN